MFSSEYSKFFKNIFWKTSANDHFCQFQSSCIPRSLALSFKWDAFWHFVATHALGLPFKWNALTFGILWQHIHSNPVSIFSHFWQLHHSWELNLLLSISGSSWFLPTWLSSFSGHRFKLESEDFIFHILQRNFSNFSIKILVWCSVRSLQSFYFSLFCSQLVYTRVQSLVKRFLKQIFFFLFLFSTGIYLFKLIKITGSFSKESIFFSGGFILLAKVIVTCQSKEKTTN